MKPKFKSEWRNRVAEAYRVVEERKLEITAVKKIREAVNLALPKVYNQLLEALTKGEELKLEQLYSREEVMQLVKE